MKTKLSSSIVAIVVATLFTACTSTAQVQPNISDVNASVEVNEALVANLEEQKKQACENYQNLRKAVAILIQSSGNNEKQDLEFQRQIGELQRQIASNDAIERKDSKYYSRILANEKRIAEIEQKLGILGQQISDVLAAQTKSKDNIAPLTSDVQVENTNSELVYNKPPKTKTCASTIVMNAVEAGVLYKARSNTSVRACANKNSEKIGIIKKGEKVEFESCDIFGWCKLKGRSGFVAGFQFSKVR